MTDPSRTDLASPVPASAPAAPADGNDRARVICGWLVDALLGAVATALIVGWSLHAGRLQLPPQYDDVAYLRQALQWVHLLQHEGIAGVVGAYQRQPAHSPLTDLSGALSFLVLGRYDWAPYAGRVVVVLLLLRILRRVMGQLSPPLRWVLTGMALTTPFVQTLVSDFRPDPVYGLLLAAMLLMILARPLAEGGWRRCALAGLLLAIVLLTKTPTYPQTLAFLLGAMLLRLLADRLEGRAPLPALRSAGWIVAIGLLLALPHYLVAWKPIHYYIDITLFGERRALWQLAGEPVDHLLYYLTGRCGWTQVGLRLWLLLAIALGGAVAAWCGPRRRRPTLCIILATLLVTYALPTLNPTKSRFLGMTFHFMLLLSGLWLANAGLAARGGDGWWPRRQRALAVGTAAGALLLWLPRVPVTFETPGDPLLREPIAEQIYQALRPHLLSEPPPRLMLTAPGLLINGDLFAYWAMRRDGRLIDTEQNLFTDDLEVHRQAMRRADLVIAGERFNGEAYPEYPSSAAQDQTLALARSLPELLAFARVPAHNGKAYHLFVRADRLMDQPFGGFDEADGLSAPAGPYPEHRLPVMRSGMGASTTLRFEADGRAMLLLVEAMSLPPSRTLRVRLNGEVVEEMAFDVPQQFRSFVLELPGRAGRNELRIDYVPPGEAMQKVVHFSRLQLVPQPGVAKSE